MSKWNSSRPRTAEVERRLKGHPLLSGWDLKLVRKYRIKFCEVLEYQNQSDLERPLILVKHRLGIVPSEKCQENLAKEFHGLEAVWNRADSSLEGMVPRPLAYLPEALAIVFDKLPGRNLEMLMKWEGNCVTGSLRLGTFRKLAPMIGQWLSRYHQLTAQPPDIHDSSGYLAKVSKWLELCREHGLDGAAAQEVLDRVSWASDGVRGEVVLRAALHGDLIPINVLVDKGRVSVVDFGGYRECEPIYEDLGMWLAYLGLMGEAGFYSRRITQVMARGFIEGYGGPVSKVLLDLYILKATMDILACQFRSPNGSAVRSRKLRRLERYLVAESRRRFPDPNYRKSQDTFEKLSMRSCDSLLYGRELKKASKKKPEIVDYRVGLKGMADAANYDALRYMGPAKEYKQSVMANAYKKLIGRLRGKRILDVGCGTGRGVIEFAQEADFAVGSDASLDMLSFAKRKASGQTNCALSAAYAQQLPISDNVFDVVTSLNFLHLFNLENQRQMIAEMKRVTKPGGIIVLEFDNALHGLFVGLYKRWLRDEQGSLPWEVRYVLGDKCRIVKVYGAVFPIVWRLLWHFPRASATLEKIAYFPLFNRLSHRIYYKLIKNGN